MDTRDLARQLALLGVLANVLLFSLVTLYPFEFSLDPSGQHRHEREIERNWLEFGYLLDNNFKADLVRNLFVLVPFGVCWAAWRGAGRRSPGRPSMPGALLAGFLLSALAEALQLFIPGRFFQISDIAVNTLGAAAGGAIGVGLLRLYAVGTREVDAPVDRD